MRPLFFPALSAIPGLRHAITTRDSGFSGGDFATLNLAFHVGDDADVVRRNRHALADELGYNAEQLIAAQQVHGGGCVTATRADVGRGALDWDSALPATDAIVTTESGLPLLILVADCAPILLADPDARVLAVVHAGWRGARAGVASNAVRTMETLGARPKNIRAGIGPCLCVRNLEIGAEVAATLEDKTVLKPHGEKFLLDLRALIQRDLRSVGVDQIEVNESCPKDEGKTFFSHRGQNGVAGRFGIVAWWE